jgi:hypothetical protein
MEANASIEVVDPKQLGDPVYSIVVENHTIRCRNSINSWRIRHSETAVSEQQQGDVKGVY